MRTWQFQQAPQVHVNFQPTSSAMMNAPASSHQLPLAPMNSNPVLQEQQPYNPQEPRSECSPQSESLNRSNQQASMEQPVASMDDDVVIIEQEESASTQQSDQFVCTDEQKRAMTEWFETKNAKKYISQKDRLELTQETGIPDRIIIEYTKNRRSEIRNAEKT